MIMGSQYMIRAVLLLVVIQLHCETSLAAKDALQSPISKRKKHLDGAADLDSLERNWDPIVSPYVMTQRKPQTPTSKSYRRQIHSSEAADLNNLRRYADPYIIQVPERKPPSPGKSRRYLDGTADLDNSGLKSYRRQIHSGDAADLNNLRRYADPSPYIIQVPERKPQPPSKSRRYLDDTADLDNSGLKSYRRQIHSGDEVDLGNLRRYADPSFIIPVPELQPPSKPFRYFDDAADLDNSGLKLYRRQIYSGDEVDLGNLRRYADPSSYIIEMPDRKPQPPSKSLKYFDATADLDNSGLYSVPLPSRITASDHKPRTRPSNSHGHQVYSSDVANLDNLRNIITFPQRQPAKSKSRRMYSNDGSGKYSDDATNEYSNGILGDYLANQYSDAMFSFT